MAPKNKAMALKVALKQADHNIYSLVPGDSLFNPIGEGFGDIPVPSS